MKNKSLNFYAPNVDFSDEEIKKSLEESKILAKIRSDNIVHYNNSWIDKSGILYIQMELCFNTLERIMEQKLKYFKRKCFELMNETEYYISSELFIEILEAVNYLHSLKPPIIHRDLNPTNILITRGSNGRFVRVADFGLATTHKFDGQTHTQDVGSVRYVSPEVTRGRTYDTKADIFSLGVITEELFAIDIYS